MSTLGKFFSVILIPLALVSGWWVGVTQERSKSAHSSHLHSDSTGHGPISESAERDLYTCGMHPQVIQEKPGNCPICGMELVKMKASKGSGAHHDYTTIEPQIVQNMGVRTASVKVAPLSRAVRSAGYLTEAESRVYEVNLLVSGWIRKLSANATGMHVEKGAPLFELYSPEVQVAITELIEARKSRSASPALAGPMKSLFQNASRKLERWGLTRQQVEELAARDSAPDTIAIQSPMRGYVAEKNVVEGAAVESGMKALKLVDYTVLWLDAQVFAQDLPFVQRAERATLSSPALPGTTFLATVSQAVLPVDRETRAATIRLDVQNPLLFLRPGMFVNVDFSLKSVEKQLLVPREAIIDSGVRKIVFVPHGLGHYEAREVTVGLEGDAGMVQVLSGLADGEEVVTSGQFLLDSESRLAEAIKKFTAPVSKKPNIAANHGATKSQEVKNGIPGDSSPTSPEPVSRAEQAAVDKLVSSYLIFSRDLGAVVKDDYVFDSSPVSGAASALFNVASDFKLKQLARDISQAAVGLEGKASSEQRENFKRLSELMVKLVSSVAPSPAIANSLYLFHCPMADADWLQSENKIANPYYSSSMKSCGELVKELKASDTPAGGR